MNRDWRVVLTAALALLAYPSVGHAQTALPRGGWLVPSKAEVRSAVVPPGFPSFNSIHGIVVDQVGTPLPRVRVRVIGPAMAVSATQSDGQFHVASLPQGQYVVRASLPGYAVARSQRLNLDAGFAPTVRLTMVREGRGAGSGPSPRPPTELTAGFGASDAPRTIETSDSAAEGQTQADGDSADPENEPAEHQNHSETAWRLRHLERSPLKDAAANAGVVDSLDGQGLVPDTMTILQRAMGTSMRMASSLFDLSLSGQVNLLASGAFDRPGQLFSSNQFAQNVAYVSLGSDAGDLGNWTVRGAMMQGDVSSWILAGFIVAPETNRHAYDMGMSYSVQRYDSSQPAAVTAAGARNAAEVYGFDRWNISPKLALGYGARYSRYDYLAGSGLLSPRVDVTVTPADRFRVTLVAARRMIAPGADELVPAVSAGFWLPPSRTFSPLVAYDGFRVERTDHYEIGVEHDLDRTVVVAFRTYRQDVNDQLAMIFDARGGTNGRAALGHYYVATAGDVRTHGWTAGVSHEIGTVRSTVEYSLARAVWVPGRAADAIARASASAARAGPEALSDLTASVRAEIPQTATRLFVLYRLNNGFAGAEDVRHAARFDVQVNQPLPFLNFSDAQWEMLLDVRNLFRDPETGASAYDEILVMHPPKRIVGGILLRF